MADIEILIDLDNNVYQKSLDETEKASEVSGKKIGAALDKGISDTLNNSVVVSVNATTQSIEAMNSTFSSTFANVTTGLKNTVNGVSGVAAASAALTPLLLNLKDIRDFGFDIGRAAFSPRTLFGFTSALGTVSLALAGVNELLKDVDNSLVKFAASTAKVAAVLTGGLSVAIGFVIIESSRLANELGKKLVSFFDEAAIGFNKLERGAQVFGATIDSMNRSVAGGVGTIDEWNKTVLKVSDTFNLAETSVRKAAQEILLVGPKLGLVQGQMEKLTKVSAEYAKINNKDVFQTTVNFVNALNGNAQAVAALGVKLTQASLQQFAYSQGITKSIGKLTEAEKVQLRYNKVLKQYKDVAGIGVIAANSLADQQVRLERNQKRLVTALGEGARVIEQNNLVAFALNTVLDNVSDSVLKVAGTLGAFGARLLQVGGFVVGLGFKLFAVFKIFKILDAALASNLGIKAFNSSIPIINKSLNQLISNLVGTQVQIKSLNSLLAVFTTSSGKLLDSFLNNFRRNAAGTIPFVDALRVSFAKLGVTIRRTFITLLPFLIPLAKIAAIGSLVAGAIAAVYKAIEVLDEKTGAVTELLNIFKKTLEETSSIFDPLIQLVNSFKDSIIELASKGFGRLVSAVAAVFSTIAAIARRNPFGVFSEETVANITAVEMKLDSFRDRLSGVAFDIRKISDETTRSIAGGFNEINFEQITSNLQKLRDEYANFGKSQLQILKETEAQRLETIRLSYENQLIGLQEFETLRSQIEADFRERRRLANEQAALNAAVTFDNVAKAFIVNAKRMKSTAGELSKTILNVATQGFGNAFTRIGQAIANGTNTLQAFADGVKAVFGDLAGALGDYYIKQGIARIAAGEPGGSSVLAAGAALKVLAGALGASGTTGGTAGSGGGVSAGAEASPSTANLTEFRETREEPKTELVVNIQGDVLDSDETGTRIANILSESFGKEGIVLTDTRFA